VSAYTQRDYEAIEAAVLESPRGRWFLGEFTRRNRAADTLMLLEAIRKLERGMAPHLPHQLSEELALELQGLSEAIASILPGIIQSPDVWRAVVEVPEHAADRVLIEKVRDAMEQLSRVKGQIDRLLADRASSNAADVDETLTDENSKYFEGDEELFESAPEAGRGPIPPLVVVGEERTRRTGNQAAQADPGASSVGSSPKTDPKDRIVLIRRATSKETSIPLADEAEDPVSAGRSQPGS
jgi:hypothetical protein